MSSAPDGRGLATEGFDDDEIEWDDESDPNDEFATDDDNDGLSPIERLADAGSDIFEPNDDEPDED